jgi:hypothetical protein
MYEARSPDQTARHVWSTASRIQNAASFSSRCQACVLARRIVEPALDRGDHVVEVLPGRQVALRDVGVDDQRDARERGADRHVAVAADLHARPVLEAARQVVGRAGPGVGDVRRALAEVSQGVWIGLHGRSCETT